MGWLPTRITQPVSAGLFICIVTVIWLELIIGLLATSYTAFFKTTQVVDVLPFLIFAVDVSFVTVTLFFTCRSAWSRLHGDENNSTINWLTLGLATIETVVIITVLHRFNNISAGSKHSDVEVAWLAVGLFVMTFFVIKMGLLMYFMQRKEDTPLKATELENDETEP